MNRWKKGLDMKKPASIEIKCALCDHLHGEFPVKKLPKTFVCSACGIGQRTLMPQYVGWSHKRNYPQGYFENKWGVLRSPFWWRNYSLSKKGGGYEVIQRKIQKRWTCPWCFLGWELVHNNLQSYEGYRIRTNYRWWRNMQKMPISIVYSKIWSADISYLNGKNLNHRWKRFHALTLSGWYHPGEGGTGGG